MKLSLNWLKKYIDHGLTPEELSTRMTMAGLEVEHVERVGEDIVFEIEVTPNRPDCLSVLGLAREISAIVDRDLVLPDVSDQDDKGEIDISIENPTDCGRYIGTIVTGVKVKPFSAEHSEFLQSLGLKQLSNVVDVTNFVLFEYGQPLHAFDLDRLEGKKIIVRRARAGEKIVTLDGVERKLDESILVVADERRPVAIAGIMGGMDTAVTSATKNILLEAASFELGVIRRASRKLALTSDSCYRFERGTAWRTIETASARATDLVLSEAGGTLYARRDFVAQKPEISRREIVVCSDDISNLIGADLDLTRSRRILKRLGCMVPQEERHLTVIPPHFRNDIQIKQDVIEEIARIIGYDNLPMTIPQVPSTNISVNKKEEGVIRSTNETLVGLGFNEIITYALTGRTALEKANYTGPLISLKNPMSTEQEVMKPTALVGMLSVASGNINRGQKDLRLFELGKRYLPGREMWSLSLLMGGKYSDDWRVSEKRTLDFFDLKGALQSVLGKLGVSGVVFSAQQDDALESGQSAQLSINGQYAGRIGRVRDEVLARFDIKKSRLYFAELDLDGVLMTAEPLRKFLELNDFPSMTRDLSLAVRDVSFDAITSECMRLGAGLLQKINFVELYSGDKMDAGFRGYVFSLVYQSKERTLTDEEVNTLNEKIAARLTEIFHIKRR
jgi:phenylalanyl-tRNA synthetase beta chain